ncbi:hypothetical protein D1007_02300 [Hordeum vulgare]|nr:hypothetical protein D1007_02300 [Hordeum vulgare]
MQLWPLAGLDLSTLHFSYLLAPAKMPWFGNYRVGKTLDDGRLCITSVEDQVMRVWVHGKTTWSDDNAWHLEREMNLTKVYDTVSSLHKDKCPRIFSVWLNDLDAGRTASCSSERLRVHAHVTCPSSPVLYGLLVSFSISDPAAPLS